MNTQTKIIEEQLKDEELIKSIDDKYHTQEIGRRNK